MIVYIELTFILIIPTKNTNEEVPPKIKSNFSNTLRYNSIDKI